MKKFLLIPIFLSLIGCAQIGNTEVNLQKAETIKVGMTYEEVVEIIGKPFLVQKFPDNKMVAQWTQTKGNIFMRNPEHKSVDMGFKDGKFVKILSISETKD